jgi:hypothetical protein
MDMSGAFARVVALIGDGTVALRRMRGSAAHPQAVGQTPAIPPAKPQGDIPTLKMPTAMGWPDGKLPVAAFLRALRQWLDADR